MILGYHIVADFEECDRTIINDMKRIEEIMLEVAKEVNATVISSNFNMFYPYGVSGVLIIAESHFTIHTWVDEKFSAIDIFVCDKNVDIKKAVELLKDKLKAKRVNKKFFERGF